MDQLFVVAASFKLGGAAREISEFGSGRINDSYLVTLAPPNQGKVILQRINRKVFPFPELIMRNIRTVTDHINTILLTSCSDRNQPWVMPHIIPAQDGKDFVIEADGSFWRAVSFIDHAQSYDQIKTADHAAQAGYALGKFHQMISTLDPARLHDTLPGFHITPGYLDHYDRIVCDKKKFSRKSAEVKYCREFIEARRTIVSTLEDARQQNQLAIRPIHGDPKLSNIMIDTGTGLAVSIIDLDTVKPGLVQYDIGDCLRSSCNPAGEETDAIATVRFEPDLCRIILKGYLAEADYFMTTNDYGYIYEAVRLIAFELGLRYFTDYLEGNRYFKAIHPDQNLSRALVQFRLTESIEKQESSIRKIVADLQ